MAKYKPKGKNFSKGSVMNTPFIFATSEGMYLAVKKHCKNLNITVTSYFRGLIKNDLNIDDYGKKTE